MDMEYGYSNATLEWIVIIKPITLHNEYTLIKIMEIKLSNGKGVHLTALFAVIQYPLCSFSFHLEVSGNLDSSSRVEDFHTWTLGTQMLYINHWSHRKWEVYLGLWSWVLLCYDPWDLCCSGVVHRCLLPPEWEPKKGRHNPSDWPLTLATSTHQLVWKEEM